MAPWSVLGLLMQATLIHFAGSAYQEVHVHSMTVCKSTIVYVLASAAFEDTKAHRIEIELHTAAFFTACCSGFYDVLSGRVGHKCLIWPYSVSIEKCISLRKGHDAF